MPIAILLNPGERYGNLSVLGEGGRSPSGRRTVRCKCDCGRTGVFCLNSLRIGETKSCGCLKVKRLTTHGQSNTPEYRVWAGMIQRCVNENETGWIYYGGRGISVCDEWRASFEAFICDMGMRPSGKYSIERIDNDGNYEPGNCVWATRAQQGSNTSKCIKIHLSGQTKTLTQWAAEFGLKPQTVNGRYRSGYRIPRLFEPLHQGVA